MDTKQGGSNSNHAAADFVWLKMSEFFGEKWTKSTGKAPNRSWVDALNTLEPSQIKRGLSELVKMGKEWPPSLPAFVGLCRGLNDDSSFDRFISRQTPSNYAEFFTAGKVGYRCRTQLADDKARALWSKTLAVFNQKVFDGEIPNALPPQIEEKPEHKQALTGSRRTQFLDEEIERMMANNETLIGPFKKRYEDKKNGK